MLCKCMGEFVFEEDQCVCVCTRSFSALSIYLSLHLFPSVTLSFCKYSLQLFVTLSSVLPPSLRACWTLLRVGYMLMKVTLFQENFNLQFGILSKLFFNSQIWQLKIKSGNLSFFYSLILCVPLTTHSQTVLYSEGSPASLIKFKLSVFTSGFVGCHGDNIQSLLPAASLSSFLFFFSCWRDKLIHLLFSCVGMWLDLEFLWYLFFILLCETNEIQID